MHVWAVITAVEIERRRSRELYYIYSFIYLLIYFCTTSDPFKIRKAEMKKGNKSQVKFFK